MVLASSFHLKRVLAAPLAFGSALGLDPLYSSCSLKHASEHLRLVRGRDPALSGAAGWLLTPRLSCPHGQAGEGMKTVALTRPVTRREFQPRLQHMAGFRGGFWLLYILGYLLLYCSSPLQVVVLGAENPFLAESLSLVPFSQVVHLLWRRCWSAGPQVFRRNCSITWRRFGASVREARHGLPASPSWSTMPISAPVLIIKMTSSGIF